MERKLALIAILVGQTGCEGADSNGQVSYSLSLGPISIDASRCVEACPTPAACGEPRPCLPVYTITSALTIVSTSTDWLTVTDLHARVIQPNGEPKGDWSPQIRKFIPEGGSATERVIVVTTPGVLEDGSDLAVTVSARADRGDATEITVRRPLPLMLAAN